jgi:MarR family transcriptional regulator, 2-MHQ and catechol-resistance regulon repressor
MKTHKPGRPEAMLDSTEDTSGVHVWLVLWKAFFALGSHAERQVNALGLGQSEFRVLEVLLAKGPQPVNVIGPKVNLTPGSISVAVERLVGKGLVRRREEPGDRRVRLVELTVKGRAIIISGFRLHREAMEAAAAGLSMAERVTLIPLLKKLGKGAALQSEAAERVGEKRPRRP